MVDKTMVDKTMVDKTMVDKTMVDKGKRLKPWWIRVSGLSHGG